MVSRKQYSIQSCILAYSLQLQLIISTAYNFTPVPFTTNLHSAPTLYYNTLCIAQCTDSTVVHYTAVLWYTLWQYQYCMHCIVPDCIALLT